MKRILLAVLLSLIGTLAFAQTPPGGYGPTVGGSGGGTTFSSTPGTPGLTAIPVSNGLIAEYRMLPTETCGALVDYSGSGNNATATEGTAPTIISGSGGCNFTGNGAIQLPAALNSAVTVLMYVNAHPPFNAFEAYLQGNGGGTSTHSFGIFSALSTGGASSCTMSVPGVEGTFLIGNGVIGRCSAGGMNGIGSVGFICNSGGSDQVVFNGVVSTDVDASTGNKCGLQTQGFYLLGGGAVNEGFGVQSYFTGQIYYAVFYNRILSAAELLADHNYMASVMASRQVPPLLRVAASTNDSVVFDGDSITSCKGVSTCWTSLVQLSNTNGLTSINSSSGSRTMAGIVSGSFARAYEYLQPTAARNTLLEWAGTNDVAGGSTAALTASLNFQACKNARTAGFKCALTSMISRTGQDTNKDNLNPLLRTTWNTSADFFIDMGGTTQLGADSASANTTFFQVDAIHPTQNAVDNVITPIEQLAYNRFYGNRDFTTAKTYSSAAAAAIATTGATEATNTVTITFAGSNTCLPGTLCTCTGITPTGYNQTYFALSGSNATTLIGYNLTTGLGAQTIAGSCSSPEQQDADQHVILNFGAGNFTLQTCQGYTGQQIFIKNINTVGSTLVAFPAQTGSNTPWSAETFDGAATLAIAQNQVRILESQLVSQAAGGCTWKVIQ
jgi:hypothetical protein